MPNNQCKYCRQTSKVNSLDYWKPLGWCVTFICIDCDFEWLNTEYHYSEEIALFEAKRKYGSVVA